MELNEIVCFSDQNIKWFARRRKEKRRVMAAAHESRTFHWSALRSFSHDSFICLFGLRTDTNILYASVNESKKLYLVNGPLPEEGSVIKEDNRLF